MSSTTATFQCPGCGRQFRWKQQLAGRPVKCKCGSILTVPDKPQAAQPASAAKPAHRPAPARSAAPAPAHAAEPDDDPLAALAGAAAETGPAHLPHRTHHETTFAHTLHAHVDRFGRIDHDWPCGQCGASVRGQPAGGACPQCGAAIQMTNPRELGALRKVSAGLALLAWGGLLMTVVAVMSILLQGCIGLMVMSGNVSADDSAKAVGAIVIVAAVGIGLFSLAAFVIDLIGKFVCLAIPEASQARGSMGYALVAEGASFLFLLGGGVVAVVLQPLLGAVGSLLAVVAALAMFGCVVSYLGKAARYTQCFRAARSAGSLMILWGGWATLTLLAVVLQVVANQQLGDAAQIMSDDGMIRTGPMIGGLPAMLVLSQFASLLANLVGLIVLSWYTTLSFGFRKRLGKLIARSEHAGGQ